MMNTTLGQRIAALRREKGLKQDELAEKLGVSPQAVSKWENDQTCPDISLLPSLAKILGVSVDELLSGKTENIPAVRILPEDERKDIKDMMLRIVATSAGGDTVRVSLPLAIIEVAIDSGLNMAQVSGNEALKNIDLNRIMDMVRQGAIGNLIEVESAGGDTVQICVE
jgi:transcriptional regulator with XRE-family HTH domain